MSDPVANVDIEDVLSSIRKLVSNGPDKHASGAQEGAEPDRLVLTPAQRVDEATGTEPEPESAAEEVCETQADHAPASGPAATQEGDDDAGAPEPAERAGDAGAMHEDGEAASGFSLGDWAHEDEGARADAHSDGGEGAVDSRESGDVPDGAAGAAGEDPALAGIAAMFARHEAAAATTWEPDGDDEDAFADRDAAPALDWRDIDAPVQGHDTPGGDGREDGATGARNSAQGGEPEAGAAGWQAEDNAFAIDDEAVLDEEALRDLVAEIVREELMGALGERITRNVRKLVRREIHRALNSQEFD